MMAGWNRLRRLRGVRRPPDDAPTITTALEQRAERQGRKIRTLVLGGGRMVPPNEVQHSLGEEGYDVVIANGYETTRDISYSSARAYSAWQGKGIRPRTNEEMTFKP